MASIRTRILLGCLSLTAVTAAFGLVAHKAETQLGTMAKSLYDDAFMSMSYLRSAQGKMLGIALSIATERDAVDPRDMAQRFEDVTSDLDVAMQRAVSPAGAKTAYQLHEDVAAIAQAYLATGKPPEPQQLAAMEDRFLTAVETNAGEGYRSRLATETLIERIDAQTWGAMGLSLLVALAITAVLGEAIVPGVTQAASTAAAIAGGRLDNDIPVTAGGEVGVLQRALRTMQASIKGQITRIEHLMATQASTHAVEMESQTDMFETALENMAQGLCMFDGEGRVIVHNERFGEMFHPAPRGTTAAVALPPDLLPGRDDQPAGRRWRSMTRTLEDGRSVAVVEKPMRNGGWVATYEDVTERHAIEARVTFMARHDALTGLANRSLGHERMEQALARVRRDGGGVSVFYMDLDHFKTVNDTLGHAAGDSLLRQVANRLTASTREVDTVIRLGGDEFAIVQVDVEGAESAQDLAERLIEGMRRPFDIDGRELRIGFSIGIAHTTDGDATTEEMLKNADHALYRSKQAGRGCYSFFDPDMDSALQTRRELEAEMHEAIAQGQFENRYQPLVTSIDGRISGFEALVRWQHPTRGTIPPNEFLPIAEEAGMIGAIGTAVLRHACADALDWPDDVRVAVNLSQIQFRNDDLARIVAAALAESGLHPSRLELEITENLLLRDGIETMQTLNAIRALGVSLSMDDFGTGYSSLAYLQRFPFDKIKIDQSFIANLEDEGEGSMAIVQAIIGLGRSLNMRIVAEGVETEDQYEILRKMGCAQVQGYLFSRPVPAREAQALVAEQAALAG